MKALTALLYLRDAEAPSAASLRTLIYQTHAACHDDDVEVPDGVIAGLLAAYTAMLAAELEAKDREMPDLVTGKVAEAAFLQGAVNGYRTVYPDTAADDSDALPCWPDWLPYNARYTPALITNLGVLSGVYDAHREQRLRQAALTLDSWR